MPPTSDVLELTGLPSREELEAELRLRDLVRFIPHLSPQYMPPVHLAPLLRRFELAIDGVPQRVCCSAPPRHGKTESVLHVPAFALRRRPDMRFAYATYADRLSRSKSRKARALAASAGVRLESDALNEWRTPEGGGLLAGGVGGPLTGHGVDVLIVDDPIKNRLEAESVTYRERLVDWWRDVAATRIEPGGSAFVFMTRWHPDDLVGQLVREGFEYINLPAVSEDNAPLWPERWPLDALESRRKEVGEYTWSSLYQGQPRPRGGRVFGDVHLTREVPGVYRKAVGLDVAYTAKTSSDYSCVVTMACVRGAAHDDGTRAPDTYYVLDVLRLQVPPPALMERLRLVRTAHPTASWRWYASGTEEGAGAFLRNVLPLRTMAPRGDKFVRAQPVAAAWNAGRVLVPEGAPWASAFVSELAAFTGVNDAHDDQVDALAAAYDELVADSASLGAATGTPTHVPSLRSVGM